MYVKDLRFNFEMQIFVLDDADEKIFHSTYILDRKCVAFRLRIMTK